MTTLLSAGVFTEEVASGEVAILGVSTSNFATVAWLPRGPENVAVNVTSLPDYFRKFGGYWKNSDGPLAVTAFFKNSGSNGWVVGVRPDDANAAAVNMDYLWTGTAYSRGAWGNLVRVVIAGNQNSYDHATALYSAFDIEVQEESVDGKGDFTVVETFEAVNLTDSNNPDYFPHVLNDADNGSKEVAISLGVSGGGIPPEFMPTSYSAEAVGTGDGATPSFTHTVSHAPVAIFTAKVKVNGVVVATDNGRGKWVLASGTGYSAVSGALDYTSGVLTVGFSPAVPSVQPVTLDYIKAGAASVAYDLVGGTDGTAVTRAQVTDPALQATGKGLYALDTVDDILNIGLADFRGDATVAGDLISYCEGRQDCFAILDTKPMIDAVDAKNYKQVTLASLSSYAGMYWPGVKIPDPLQNGRNRPMSPVGHVAGVYARTDSNRNVGKAPAGVNEGALNFCNGLEIKVVKGDRDIVYPVGINPLIDSPQTGRAVWGTRTLQVIGDFNLVNVRRLFIFLKKSTYNSTQDLVFEPIGEELFNTTTLRMDSFLNRLTSEGYFASRVPAQAYKFICNSTNNTPDTIAARELISDILVATQNPAEFVRFRFARSLQLLA